MLVKNVKILHKRGPKERLMRLDVGELAYLNNTDQLYMGTPWGNKEVYGDARPHLPSGERYWFEMNPAEDGLIFKYGFNLLKD